LAEKQTMRNGQNNNKRMRGRNRKGGHHQNPLSRMYESNGQDVKIRGTASHIAEKYLQLARDAQSSGDTIASENYYQHAEHYFRLIAAAQEQFRQTTPYYAQQQGENRGNSPDDSFDDGDDEQPIGGEPFAPREPQPFYQREQQHPQPQQFQPQPQQFQPQPQPQHFQPQPQNFQPRPQHAPQANDEVERLPSFITGGQPAQQPPQQAQGPTNSNGHDGQSDRFPLHRRRRRHRGPRDHGGDNDSPTASGPRSTDD
jgi:hypothetical protein